MLDDAGNRATAPRRAARDRDRAERAIEDVVSAVRDEGRRAAFAGGSDRRDRGRRAPRSMWRRVAARPNGTTSTGSGKAPSADTSLEASAITAMRAEAAATIFSRRSAPPPPLISLSLRIDLVGAVDRQIELGHLVERRQRDAEAVRLRERRLRGRDAARFSPPATFSPSEIDEMACGRAGAEAEPHAGLDELERPSRPPPAFSFRCPGSRPCLPSLAFADVAPERRPTPPARPRAGSGARRRFTGSGSRRQSRAPCPRAPSLTFRPASSTSSKVRRPVVGALTSTAMLPGACRFFHILVWASGIPRPGEHLRHAGVDAPVDHELVGRRGLLEVGEMRALDALLPHPDETRVEGQVEAGCAGAENHHAAALDHEARGREGRLAGMLEHRVDVLLAGDVPDRLAELARLRHVGAVFGRVDLGQLAPAVEVLAVDDALGAERHHVVALALVRDDADRVRPRRRAELDAEHAEPPEAPQTSTLSPGRRRWGSWPNSIR